MPHIAKPLCAVFTAILVTSCQPRQIPPTPVEPPAYQHLKAEDPRGKSVEAISQEIIVLPNGLFRVAVGSGSVSFRPPSDAWVFVDRMPDAYKGGDKIRRIGFDASGSAKVTK